MQPAGTPRSDGSELRTGPPPPCTSADEDLWFSELPRDLERAKDLCRTCPQVRPCLAGALHRREPWGVWGGEIFQGGSVVPRKRTAGRPRKHERPAA